MFNENNIVGSHGDYGLEPGWEWGGNWVGEKDWQHFQKNPEQFSISSQYTV